MTETTSKTSSDMHFLSGKSIVVAGGGIGGLSFAIGITKQWKSSYGPMPKITVFERDSKEDRIGREGYTLSLRTDAASAGVETLDKLGLYQRVLEVSVAGTSAHPGSFVLWDTNWKDLMRMSIPATTESGLHHMRCRRNALQKVLAGATIEAGHEIRWAAEAISAQRNDKGGMTISLKDGSSATCDLLIAADGSKSKIRTFIRPNDKLDYAGVVCISGTARYSREEDVPQPFNRDWGGMLGLGGKGLFMAPVDNASALYSYSYYSPTTREPLHHPLSSEQIQTLLDEVRSGTSCITSKLPDMISATDPTTLMVFNAMDRPPFKHDLASHGPVIFIGDANHAVSPFAGNGANMALMDGWELSTALCENSTLDSAVLAYEKMFIPRTQRTLKMSHFNIGLLHSSGLKLWFYKFIFTIAYYLFFRRRGNVKEKEN